MDKAAALVDILAQNPGDAFARYALAQEYRQRNEPALALDQFDELARRHPDYTAGYQMAAQLLLAESRFDEAAQRLEAGLAAARRTRNQHAASEMQAMLDELELERR